MFGYTTPMYSRLSASDLSYYRGFYCETCHQLKSEFGLVSTAAVNYDMTFNAMILNSLTGNISDFGNTGSSPLCVLKKPRSDSDVMRRMAGYTVLLTKWELTDDSIDKPSLKTDMISLTLGRAIAKAERMYPEYDDIIARGFGELRSMELSKCTDAILIGRTFGRYLTIALDEFAGDASSDELNDLFTELTTLVYVMDAVDDLDQDYMDGTYNPYLEGCDGYINRRDYMSKHVYDVTESMNSIIGSLQTAYSSIRKDMTSCVGISDNIVYFGLPDSAKKTISGSSEAKASVKNALNRRKIRNGSY